MMFAQLKQKIKGERAPQWDNKSIGNGYATVRGESEIVREKQIQDNMKMRIYEGYLKERLNSAKAYRLSSISLDSEAQTDKEAESMMAILKEERNSLYDNLDAILIKLDDKSDTESGIPEEVEKNDDWRLSRIRKLQSKIRDSSNNSFFLRNLKRLPFPKSNNKTNSEETNVHDITDFEEEITYLYSRIQQVEEEIGALKFIKFQDLLTDKERTRLDQLYSELIEEIDEEETISVEYKKNLQVHFERERSKIRLAKNQNLSGYKREIYRIDDVASKRSIYVARVIPAGHDIISEMSDIKGGGWRSNQIEKWKDNLIWVFLIITNIISLSIAFLPQAQDFFTKGSTWGYASGYFLTAMVSWKMISLVSENLGAYEAVYNIEKVMKNETIHYFNEKGELEVVVTDVYELELINSSKNNLDVSLGRSANDVANLTNQTMVRMSRQLSKQLVNSNLENEVANEEKQSLLNRIQDLKEEVKFSYYQGVVDGADMRGQVLIQLGESRAAKQSGQSWMTPEVAKYLVMGITIIGGLFLLIRVISNTDFVFDFTSQGASWFFAIVGGFLTLFGIAMVINISKR